MAIRKRVHEILEVANPGDLVSRVVDIAIMSLIVLNVAALVLESVSSYKENYGDLFDGFEAVSLGIFTVEYIFRIWSSVEDPAYASPISGRLRFALTPQALVDLLVVLPFYINIFANVGIDTRFVRILRLLKLARYIDAMRMFQRVIVRKRAELMVTLIIIGILLVFTACLIYTVEHDHPGSQFENIPQAMWWSIVTLTTVGYGDISPITTLGRFLAGFVAILGIGMFALPTSILGAAFLEEMSSTRQARRRLREEDQGQKARCPHCGEQL